MTLKYDLFREVTLNITSSLDMAPAWERTFAVLCRHLPLAGMSFHEFREDLGMLRLYYLVTERGFIHVDKAARISDEAVEFLRLHRKPRLQKIIPCNKENPVGAIHSQLMKDYLPSLPRGHMMNILALGDEILTSMVLLGTEAYCFTEEHLQLMKPLLPVLSLAMANMMQFKMNEEFRHKLGLKNTLLQEEVDILSGSSLVGAAGGLAEVFNNARRLAGNENPVLITGETGTGKELVAELIQRLSSRRQGPFIKVNCGALPDTLMDSELFGVEKGAYTGAFAARPGRFEQADGGTLFLDEVGELSPKAQVRLLRVLQNREVERLGGGRLREVSVRIIAATNSNLENMLQNGSFREDLYYRLNVLRIHVPPLRERKEDIVPLIKHFAAKAAGRSGQAPLQLELSSLERVLSYSWPGNVRELENMVERAVAMNPFASLDISAHLPHDPSWHLSRSQGKTFLEKLIDERVSAILARQGLPAPDSPQGAAPVAAASPGKAGPAGLDEIMASAIESALDVCRGKINGPGGAAELLRLNPSTLRKRMLKMGVSAKKFPRGTARQP
ncbi:MAG: sigma-54 dependent transcriptional regulator [Desulfovibrio sp.]|jgi:transcriptional regulator with GAF, ATPase, and Fis domain|nr:sigma-54 dependent transcriptional regulator [Desulfovibrio sp.]